MSTDAPIRKGRALTLSTSGAPVNLEVARLRRDGGTQPRAGIDPAHVARLVEALEAGEILPAVTVFHDGQDHWLADGFHRVAAFEQRGGHLVSADIRQGTRRDAVLYSVGANRAHGLPRSRDDLWRAIETLLRDEEWVQWSDREIARQVGCSHPHVGKVRQSLAAGGNVTTLSTRKAPDGKSYSATQPARPVEPAAPTTFTDEEIAASIRSCLLRLDVHAAAPLLAGLRSELSLRLWRDDIARVAGIAGLVIEDDQATAAREARRISDDALRAALVERYAAPPTPAPELLGIDDVLAEMTIDELAARAPAPFDVAHWERRAYAIGANLKGYGQHWELVEPDGTKSRYPNGCEDQLARRIAQLDQRKATTAASVVAGDLDAQTERAYQHLETELADDLDRLGTEGSRRLAVLLLDDADADSESLWEALTSTARERPDLIHVLGERR